MAYQCVATSVAGFIQQLAVGYVTHGYYFYVAGWIPEGKDPERTDHKIMAQYDIDVSRWTRARRKKAGLANVHYLRYGRFYVIIANHGEQPFFAAEARQLRDIRVSPLNFMGYSIGCRKARNNGKFHASVRIHGKRYRELKTRFAQVAVERTVEDLSQALRAIPYEPYARVRDQLRRLVRSINRRRKAASLELVPGDSLRCRRRPLKPFAPGPALNCRLAADRCKGG